MAQSLALSLIPFEELEGQAVEAVHVSVSMGEEPPMAKQDAFALAILDWFKGSFFTWVGKLPCNHCGCCDTREMGVEALSDPALQWKARTAEQFQQVQEEMEGGASRVEILHCPRCNHISRFPRYNKPTKLLETRRGRCGEWANCFGLCCRAMGLDVRYILDWSDHVWVEYYSDAMRRWVHMDPCEAAHDKPLLYEHGWGKQQSIVAACHCFGVHDVTKRYTSNYAATAARRGALVDGCMALCCQKLMDQLRSELGEEQKRELEARDAAEACQLAAGHAGMSAAELAALPGRQTGSEQWRQQRGEMGSKPAASMGTPYVRAGDLHLKAQQPSHLTGGFVRASGENRPHETASKAFDGNLHTKWLDFGGANGRETWLEYSLGVQAEPVILASFGLTSANDFPERDPKDFVLEGIAAGSGTWEVLSTASNAMFSTRHQLQTFAVGHHKECRRFRLRITALRGAANCVQLGQLALHVRPSTPEFQSEAKNTPQASSATHEELADISADVDSTSVGDDVIHRDLSSDVVKAAAALHLGKTQLAMGRKVGPKDDDDQPTQDKSQSRVPAASPIASQPIASNARVANAEHTRPGNEPSALHQVHESQPFASPASPPCQSPRSASAVSSPSGVPCAVNSPAEQNQECLPPSPVKEGEGIAAGPEIDAQDSELPSRDPPKPCEDARLPSTEPGYSSREPQGTAQNLGGSFGDSKAVSRPQTSITEAVRSGSGDPNQEHAVHAATRQSMAAQIQAEFARLMALGHMQPNEAAVAALCTVKGRGPEPAS